MIGNYANIIISNPAGVTPSVALTSTNITGNLAVAANGVLNNAGLAITLASGKSFTMQAGSQFNLTGTSTMAAVSGGGTKTFDATSTVSYIGTSDQNVTAETYGNLVLGGGTTKTPATGTTTVAGNLTLNTGTTYGGATNNPTVNLAGNFTESGTFNSGSGTFTFNGSSAQTLSGTSTNTTFTNLRMNNASGLSINHNVTVSTLLTLTSGVVSTGSNTLITSANCPGSISRTGGHVAGFLRLRVPTGSASCTFDVGDGTTYRPVNVAFSSVTTTGDLTGSVSQSAGDHPNISTSGLDDTQSVNRYWTLTNSGVVLSSFGATFNFVAGDVDGGADPLQFEVERWDGAAWNTTSAGTRTSTSTQATGITAFSDFASGKKKPVPTPGSFNAFESSTSIGAITGVIRTRVAGSAFSLDVVAIASGAQQAGFTDAVIVELLGNNTLGVALDAQNCPVSFTLVQTVAPNPTITGGRSTVSFAAVANSWRDVRVRVRWPTTSPTVTWCSTDNFAIRPSNFSAPTSTFSNSGTSGTPVTTAGGNFDITVVAIAGYNGTPIIDNTKITAHAGAVQIGNLSGSFGAANPATGSANGSTFTYSEVGNFTIGVNGVFDSSYTSVDPSGTECTNDFSNTLVGGLYGCKFGNNTTSAAIGRFRPDHFIVTLGTLTNRQALSCAPASTHTYEGEQLRVTFMLTARNGLGTPATTQNYTTASGFAKLDGTVYANFGFGAVDLADATPPLTATALTARVPSGTSSGTWVGGIGSFTVDLSVSRAASPDGPFESFRLGVLPVDADGVTLRAADLDLDTTVPANGNDRVLVGGSKIRFGRLAVRNANGSQLVPLPVQVEAQYWSGAPTNAFITNTQDSCTSIASANDAMGNYTANLSGSPTCETAISGGGPLSAGRKTLQLAAPGSANYGSVDLTVNLGASASGTTCTTVGGAPVAATTANLPYLQGNWTGGAYTVNPTARATFGVFKGAEEVIFVRENF